MSERIENTSSDGQEFRVQEVALVLATEVPAPTDQPPIVKTPYMLDVEERIGEPLEKRIGRLMRDEGLAIADICQDLDVSRRTLTRWAKSFGIISPHTWGDETRARITEGMNRSKAERRNKGIVRIRSEASKRKQGQTFRRIVAKGTRLGEQVRSTGLECLRGNWEEARRRHEDAFGEDTPRSLREMHYGGLSLTQIAEETGYKEGYIDKLMIEAGVENITPSQEWHEKNAQIRQILPYIWEHPESMGLLTVREREALERRHLLEGITPTLQEVGEDMGVGRERVRQLENGAIGKLRAQSEPVEED